MQSHYISHRQSSIHYRQFGKSPRILFCFHGYGRESDTFYLLEKRLGDRFTIIAPDVPFHGRTKWKDELIFEPAAFVEILMEISSSINLNEQKFTFLGFSMGGRIAMHLAQLLPGKVERLVLLAPDGFNFNFWRWLGSDTYIGNRFLSYTIRQPKWAEWVLNKAEKWKVLPGNLAQFVRYYVQDEEQRTDLYHRYISMRRFKPDLKLLQQQIRQYQIPVKMLFGKYDRVINYKGGERFRKGIEKWVSIQIIPAGHHLLTEANANTIVRMINE